MTEARTLLQDYVATGKTMQLATVDTAGAPAVCNLFFASAFCPDRLFFISRPTREHCANLRADPRVAGAILAIDPIDPGHPVRGVSFTGQAQELPTTGVDEQIGHYVGRWPVTSNAIDPARLAAGETHHRLYQIDITGWILYDELNFRPNPRQPVAPQP